jgi:simple sugar transport system substrate-binding protein
MKVHRSIATVLAATFVGAALFAASAIAQDHQYKFDIVVHDGQTSFYAPVQTGMEVACAELKAVCSFSGPPNGSDPVAQVDMAQNAINAGIDGIILDIPDRKAMEKVVKLAKSKNVDVYFIGTSYPDMLDYGSMGQNFYNAGLAVGKQAIKYLPNGGGKVAIVTCCAGNIPLGQRAQGTTDALKAAGNFTVVGPVLLGNDATQQYGAMEAMYQANPDIVGIFGTDASTEVIARFIEKNNLKGKVVGGGFDLLPATVEAIKKGEMAFTTTQNPFLWGYLSVHQLYLHREYNLHPISIDSGAGVVDSTNVDKVNPKYN